MCTVTWVFEGHGYQLFCNRDEKKTRSPAAPPRRHRCSGVEFLAPVDTDYGGTWIAVNECGLTLCLLNGAGYVERATRSRGHMIPQLMDAVSATESVSRAAELELLHFSPFTLLALDATGGVASVAWNGQNITFATGTNVRPPFTSSSFDSGRVVHAREREFFRLTAETGFNPSTLARFHASHSGGPSAYSTCMHRPGAGTVSFSRIVVGASRIEFQYRPSPPCQKIPALLPALVVPRISCLNSC
jgi:hypothetical protein